MRLVSDLLSIVVCFSDNVLTYARCHQFLYIFKCHHFRIIFDVDIFRILIFECVLLELLDSFAEVVLEYLQLKLVEEDLPVAETRLDSLLETVGDVKLHGCAEEHELDLAVLEHVQDLVEHDLPGGLDVVVDVLEDE